MASKRNRPKTVEKPLVTVVTARLFTEDVEAIKAQAREAGDLEWQPRLRRLVHEALKERKVVR